MNDDQHEFANGAEQAAFDEALKAKVLEALADPRPSLSHDEVRAAMDRHYEVV